jgi:hypothetical protein
VLALREVDDLLEGRDLVLPVEDRVARAQVGQALLCAQRLQLGEGEVLGQPVMLTPSTIFVVRRPANSGCRATSVVPEMSFS